MLRSVLVWLGFAQAAVGQGHNHDNGKSGHGHTHGVVDATITTTQRGLWAVKWSFVILAITAALQFAVVLVSGSVALLADMIHNIGDAVTAVPLSIAFVLARRKPSARFTYGYGRAEDLAGVTVVLIILASALVAAYEAIHRLFHPATVTQLGWLAAAGVVGFVGNEMVAIFRIRVGREIDSAALIADGYHARTDGLTSLAVVIGALGVWLGFPLADPIIGLLITLTIFGIVWQSSKAVLERMLDGVDPRITADIRHAAEHVPGISQVLDVRARWMGHRMAAELDVGMDGSLSLREVDALTRKFEKEIFAHVPALSSARIRARPYDPGAPQSSEGETAMTPHHHAPEPVPIRGKVVDGSIEIVDTPAGERMRFTSAHSIPGLSAAVQIQRDAGRIEALPLSPVLDDPTRFMSASAPEEPHEFDAELLLRAAGQEESHHFRMLEPPGHGHGH